MNKSTIKTELKKIYETLSGQTAAEGGTIKTVITDINNALAAGGGGGGENGLFLITATEPQGDEYPKSLEDFSATYTEIAEAIEANKEIIVILNTGQNTYAILRLETSYVGGSPYEYIFSNSYVYDTGNDGLELNGLTIRAMSYIGYPKLYKWSRDFSKVVSVSGTYQQGGESDPDSISILGYTAEQLFDLVSDAKNCVQLVVEENDLQYRIYKFSMAVSDGGDPASYLFSFYRIDDAAQIDAWTSIQSTIGNEHPGFHQV